MAAPIVVELAATAPSVVDPELSRALIDACSAAAGPGGCAVEADPGLEPRARVLVTFGATGERVRVELEAPSAGAGRSREVAFRDDDPRLERFRATGLVVAGLVADVSAPEPPAELPVAPHVLSERTVSQLPQRRVLVRLEGQSGWNGARPWGGVALGADLSLTGQVFLALSGAYDQTWIRDSRGISAQRAAFGLGGGVAAPLVADRLELRVRVSLELEELRASILQPGTLREDAAGRTLAGFEAGVDLVAPITGSLDAFCGGRADGYGGNTTVRVAGAPDEVIGAWMVAIAAGLNVRFQ
jgi:hypothetical protein